VEQRPTLRARRLECSGREHGVTLIEIVCVLAMIALLAAILLPQFPIGTSRPRLEAYAMKTASILAADRSAAIRRHIEVSTVVDAPARSIQSGSSGYLLRMPRDVIVDAMLPNSCNRHPVISTVNFLPSGMSCGGTIVLTRRGTGYEVRVNWLTGFVDVLSYGAL